MNTNLHILEWLEHSPLVIPLRTNTGFFVPRGRKLAFPDQSTMDALDFIQSIGVWHGDMWGNYRVVYTEPGGPYSERLTFFLEKNIYPVPFNRPEADSPVPKT